MKLLSLSSLLLLFLLLPLCEKEEKNRPVEARRLSKRLDEPTSSAGDDASTEVAGGRGEEGKVTTEGDEVTSLVLGFTTDAEG